MRMRVMLSFFVLWATGTLTVGCGSSDEEDQPSGATCPTTSSLTYDNFGSSFIQSYCLDCHSSTKTGSQREDAPTGIDFDTVANVRNLAHKIDIEAAASSKRTNTSMPPSEETAQPTLDERLKLGEWLACGAP